MLLSVRDNSLSSTWFFNHGTYIKEENDVDVLYTHYHNSNLIWRTVSCLVDEVIPSDHPRRVRISGDPMV